MLNPIASEAIFSATYVDNYIDSVENLPDDVQRQLSRIRDIDVRYRNHLRDVDHYYDVWKTMQTNKTVSPNRRARTVARVQQSLINAQELGDEKMQIVNQLQELIDQKTRQLDMDQKNLNIKENQHHQEDNQCTMPPHKLSRSHSPSREGSATNGGNGGNGNGGGNGCGNTNSNGEASIIKEVHTSGPYTGGNSLGGSGNGTSTPTSDRSGHACNGNVSQLSSNCSTNLANAAANNASLNVNVGSDSQRTASKRLRRRNEPAGHVEVCGNESNSANEAASSGGGGGGADRNSIGGNSNTALKSATTGGGSNSSQRKNSMQIQGGTMAGTTGSGTMGSGNMTTGGAGNVSGGNNSGKRKKRKARGTQQATNAQNAREETPPPDPIDPDEPTYCLCDQISFGEMILCDNDLCPIEWFHFSCVALVLKPKGKWYCPNCRGDRPNVMKPKAQFLKELERYNKEKEERT